MKNEDKNIKKKVTLKDVAISTGYSINTVSHALNGIDDIKPSTRERILEEADKIGYIGNTLAGALRSGHTKTVAIIISDITNPYFSIMVKLIESELRKYKYLILTMNTEEDNELEVKCVMAAISKNVDGIIICPTQQNDDAINLMKKNNIPFVLMGRYFQGHKYESVLGDDFLCGYLATEYLIRLGHKKILFINGPSYISSSRERYNGYAQAFTDAALPLLPELVRPIDIITHNCEALLDDMIQQDLDFTGIVTFSDIIAWETIYILNTHGYSVPEDISLVSIDNIQSHIRHPFPLTSVDVPKEQMASLIVNSLFRLINDGFSSTIKQVLTPELIIRQSAQQPEGQIEAKVK